VCVGIRTLCHLEFRRPRAEADNMRITLFAALLATACSLPAKTLKIHGYITALESPRSFEIDDYKVICDDTPAFVLEKGDYQDATFRPEDLRVGTEIEIDGEFNEARHELHAANIKVYIA